MINRYTSTQACDNPPTKNGVDNALFDLLSKINSNGVDLQSQINGLNVPELVTDSFGTYRQYPDGSADGRTVSVTKLRSAPVALTSGVVANIGSISLPPGIWRFYPVVGFTGNGATTHTFFEAGVSKTSATMPGLDTVAVPTAGELRDIISSTGIVTTGGEFSMSLIPYEYQVTVTTTFYLVASCTFAVSTESAFGSLFAISRT